MLQEVRILLAGEGLSVRKQQATDPGKKLEGPEKPDDRDGMVWMANFDELEWLV